MADAPESKVPIDLPRVIAPDKSLTVTGDGKERKGSRSNGVSPSRLPAEFAYRLNTQMGRLSMHLEAESFLPPNIEGFTLTALNAQEAQMDSLHQKFLSEHDDFERTWPAVLRDHEYFAGSAHLQACRAYAAFKRATAKLKGELIERQEERGFRLPHHTDESQPRLRLPNIKLPEFAGEYSQWPTFRDMFESLVMDSTSITDVERLHYLRGCLESAPAQLIAGFPLTGASLAPSWKQLSDRYENKCLHIQSHLDTMFSVTPLTSKSAAGLNKLIVTVSEANAALRSLEVGQDLSDCSLVQLVSRNLDRSTREVWETSLGSSNEYPTFAQLDAFITARARALERVEGAHPAVNATSSSSKGANNRTASRSAHPGSAHQASAEPQASSAPQDNATKPGTAKSGPYPCNLCGGPHFIIMCEKFRALGVQERRQAAVNKRLCFNCMGRHNVRLCRSRQDCKECSGKHHTMLHGSSSAAARAQDLSSSAQRSAGAIVGSLAQLSASHSTLLATAVARIDSPVAADQAHILRTVTTTLPSFEAPAHRWPHLDRLKLADPEFLVPRPIDIIIGADHYGQIIKPNIVKSSTSIPIAQLSVFGWLVLGPVHVTPAAPCSTRTATVQQASALLQELLTRFWVQEELPTDTAQLLTPEEEECDEHFKTTHSRDSAGRYIVRIPLKLPATQLGESYGTAHRCLSQILQRHARDSEYRDLYRQFLAEYEDLGHMVKGQKISPGGAPHYYLPHHSVLRPDRATTKMRVVFNGSSATASGYSMNDLMHSGAKLQLDIPDVLIRIRLHRCVFATDITKMFRQIKVHPDDWDLQRILWVDDQLNTIPYQLTTVTYGTRVGEASNPG